MDLTTHSTPFTPDKSVFLTRFPEFNEVLVAPEYGADFLDSVLETARDEIFQGGWIEVERQTYLLAAHTLAVRQMQLAQIAASAVNAAKGGSGVGLPSQTPTRSPGVGDLEQTVYGREALRLRRNDGVWGVTS